MFRKKVVYLKLYQCSCSNKKNLNIMSRFSAEEEKVAPRCFDVIGFSKLYKLGLQERGNFFSLNNHCRRSIRAKCSFMLTRQLQRAVFSSLHLTSLSARPSHSN